MKSLSLLVLSTLSLACALPVEASQSSPLAKLAFDMREFVRDEKIAASPDGKWLA